MKRELAAAILGGATGVALLFTFYAFMWMLAKMPDFLNIMH